MSKTTLGVRAHQCYCQGNPANPNQSQNNHGMLTCIHRKGHQKWSNMVKQTVGQGALSGLTLGRCCVDCLQAVPVVFMKSVQAPQTMASELQDTCWCICCWWRWCSIFRAQEEVGRAAWPALIARKIHFCIR